MAIDHDSTFTINDITFPVAPTQISIQKDSANFEWQTLRTKNSQKVKSGHGTINIAFSAVFVGPEAINSRLRILVAQLRLTPICYAENKYLRDSLLPSEVKGNSDKSICLILKAMTLTVQPELKDTIIANFTFALFNYLPFTNTLLFKQHMFGDKFTREPRQSAAWRNFYEAEMGETGSGTSTKYIAIDDLNSELVFSYKQFFKARTGDPQFDKTLKNTGIKYQSSKNNHELGNDFTVWAKDIGLSCNTESDRIVTSVTVSFENIVAALPVVGHQYMTYQHIGSIDPRVIVTMAVMTDAAREELVSMWHKIEQNAIDWRHIPQEFLNVTISNQLTRLTGLSTFITDSFTDETIPGQPGTYQVTISLRGTDYLHTREGISQEFITNQKVREVIVKVINRYLTVDLNGVIQPAIFKNEDNALLYKIVNGFALIAEPTSKDLDFLSNKLSRLEDKAFLLETLKNIDTETIRYVREAFEVKTERDTRPENAINFEALIVSDTIVQRDELKRDALLIVEKFSDKVNNFADNLTLDGFLDLPEFTEARGIAEKIGAFHGKPAYPDFDALERVAELYPSVNSLDLNPDFYFFTNDKSQKSIIDPGYLQAAQAAAKRLYIDDGNGGVADTGGLAGNFQNYISDYVQKIYINRFDPKSSARSSLDGALKKIEATYPKDRSALNKSKSQPATTEGIAWSNATADGIDVRSQSFGGDYNNERPEDGKVVPLKCSTSAISHFGDFKDFLEEGFPSYSTPLAQQLGIIICPVSPSWPISSPFGLRDISAQNPEASTDHKGIDFACPEGTEVRAILDGEVVRAEGKQDKNGYGNIIVLRHMNGLTSMYAHMNKMYVNKGEIVKGGDIIGRSGGVAGTVGAGNSRGAHLHFEIRQNDVPLDPVKEISKAQVSAQHISVEPIATSPTNTQLKESSSGEGFQFGTSILARSLESLEADLSSGQGQSMIRAYPTFKLYFMEEDQEERIFGFDDFFNYNAVKSIRVVRSRKIPTDLCVIELTNVSGILSNRKFKNSFNEQGISTENSPRNGNDVVHEDILHSGTTKNTAQENSITSIMLQEGTKVFLRMGYSNNPEKLEPVFIGQIAEVEFNETDDLITIVCQSYASELVQQMKGLDGVIEQQQSVFKGGTMLGMNRASTPRLLSEMLQQPEVLHFGRWIRSRSGGIPSGTFDPRNTTNTNLPILSNKFKWNPNPVDDNIFPPVIKSKEFANYFSVENSSNGWTTTAANTVLDAFGAPVAAHFSFINYYIYKMTIWDVFKEMELRHPGCIALPVPYMDSKFGPRMTMFFGLPNQLYFARDPSYREQARNNRAFARVVEKADELRPELEAAADANGLLKNNAYGRVQTILQGINGLALHVAGFASGLELAVIAKEHFSSEENSISKIENPSKSIISKQIGAFNNQVRKEFALKDRTIRPFRSYHVLTSNNHILENNIRASALDVYNSVAIEYSGGKRNLLEGGTTSTGVITEGNSLVSKDKAVFHLKADAGIPDEEVREAFVQYPSCEGEQMAEFYALGTLKQTLRDIYKGQLTIIGNPTIKPYDICYLFDEYTDMVGPVEVEQVIHSFSQETGFVTEITPDICVSINEWTTMATTDAIGLTVETLLEIHFGLATRKESTPQSRVIQRTTGVDVTSSNVVRNVGVGSAAFLALLGPAAIPAVGTVAVASTAVLPLAPLAPFALAGIFLANKLVHWSKLRHPISFSPLMYKGRPFMAAMATKTISANWITNILGFKDGAGSNAGWLKEGILGTPLWLNQIGDQLTLAADTGSLSNLGVSSITPTTNQNP